MDILQLEEFRLTSAHQKAIELLFQKCFADYPKGQTYYKQLPTFRFLVYEDDQLIGHLAVEHRLMHISGSKSPIFGVMDLCIAPSQQSKRIASTLLHQLEQLAAEAHIDFIVLVAKDHGLYLNNGFQLASNVCRWLMINDFQTLGIGQRRLDDCLMYKQTGQKTWEETVIDFLGTGF